MAATPISPASTFAENIFSSWSAISFTTPSDWWSLSHYLSLYSTFWQPHIMIDIIGRSHNQLFDKITATQALLIYKFLCWIINHFRLSANFCHLFSITNIFVGLKGTQFESTSNFSMYYFFTIEVCWTRAWPTLYDGGGGKYGFRTCIDYVGVTVKLLTVVLETSWCCVNIGMLKWNKIQHRGELAELSKVAP